MSIKQCNIETNGANQKIFSRFFFNYIVEYIFLKIVSNPKNNSDYLFRNRP